VSDNVLAELDESEVEALKTALRTPRGQYAAERAAQLAGVPVRTLYYWASEGLLIPDYTGRPMLWSYRDLVFVRLFTWLRSRRLAPHEVSLYIDEVRQAVSADDNDIRHVRAAQRRVLLGDEHFDRLTGEGFLPLLVHYLDAFNLVGPLNIPELGRSRVWGPNLIRPSAHTAISPWVMSGDPCIRRSRLPTASVFALNQERGLAPVEIVDLYRGAITEAAAIDAIELEHRLRRMPVAA
jgi:DNA-binding transcriptional MerR regulator/uncharacterized protein (DUF433 family)